MCISTKNWINVTKYDFAAVKLLSTVDDMAGDLFFIKLVLHVLHVTIAASTQSTEAEHRVVDIDRYSRIPCVK